MRSTSGRKVRPTNSALTDGAGEREFKAVRRILRPTDFLCYRFSHARSVASRCARLRGSGQERFSPRAVRPRAAARRVGVFLGADRDEVAAALARPLAVGHLPRRVLEGQPAGGHLPDRPLARRLAALEGLLRRLRGALAARAGEGVPGGRDGRAPRRDRERRARAHPRLDLADHRARGAHPVPRHDRLGGSVRRAVRHRRRHPLRVQRDRGQGQRLALHGRGAGRQRALRDRGRACSRRSPRSSPTTRS